MKKKLILMSGIVASFIPFVAFGVGVGPAACTTSTLGGIICQIGQILNSIVPVLVALGLVYFMWGVVRYVIADGEEAKDKGRDQIIYGIIGFAVIIGLWGLVNILITTFGLGGASAPQLQAITAGGNCSLITNASKLQDVLCYITGIINNSIIPLIFAVAFVMFVWGVVQFFILGAGEEEKRAQGKQFIIWGVIALTVMIAVWGLVKIVGGTFGFNTSVLPHVTPPNGGSPQGPCPDGSPIRSDGTCP